MIERRLILFVTVVFVAIAALPAVRSEEPPVLRVVKAGPDHEWSDRFSRKEGWIGGDGAYSTVLDRNRVLFLFGDTLMGTVLDGRRAGAKMVNNTVGIFPLHRAEASIQFATGQTESGEPTAIFRPRNGQSWFWPQGAVQVQGRLYVFLARIRFVRMTIECHRGRP